MALIQVRDVPDHLYRALVEQAKRERRSLSQHAIAVLAKGLDVDVDAKTRRRAVLDQLRSSPPSGPRSLSDPVKLIREDRRR